LTSCVVFIGIFGGTAYLNLSLNSLFFRDLPINKLSNLILSQVVVIGLNLVSTAILISLCLATFGFILIIAKATGIIHNRKKKNQKMKQFRRQPEITNTFDGQFQNEVLDMQEEKQPENLPDSQSFAQTDRQTEIQNIQNFSTELKSKDKIENLSQLQEEENFFNSKIENSEVDPVQLGEPIN
jgi:MFS superfamily sulfate permease-like transporter